VSLHDSVLRIGQTDPITMSNYVFLIDANKTPMNPIHSAHARK